MKDYERALEDFSSVLQFDPENKSARQQLVIASNKLREQRQKEKQMYAGMFDKLAQMDKQKVSPTSSYDAFRKICCVLVVVCEFCLFML